MRIKENNMQQQIRVWDLPVRLFHWLLVVACSLSLYSAFQDKMMTGFDTMHLYAGVSVLILVVFRDLWGFFGSTTARILHFVKGPDDVRQHMAEMKENKPYEYVGHNPIGGWSVVVMLDMLLLQACLGLFSTDAMFFAGPFAEEINEDIAGKVTLFHRWVGYGIMTIIALHISAVYYYVLVKGINLVRPMVTGMMEVDETVAKKNQDNVFAPNWLAMGLFLLSGAMVCAIIF